MLKEMSDNILVRLLKNKIIFLLFLGVYTLHFFQMKLLKIIVLILLLLGKVKILLLIYLINLITQNLLKEFIIKRMVELLKIK